MADAATMGRRVKTPSLSRTRTVIKVKINGTEKRYRPSRHYVYILQVRWSDYSEYVIYRKYSDFYILHCGLLEKFPIEAGTIKASDRVIPFLPGRQIFSRTEVSKVANQRRDELAEYCGELLKLDQKISTCAEVDDFFEPRHEDINPPKDVTKKPERSRLIIALLPFLKRYKEVDEEEREMSISDPLMLETYVAIADYDAEDKSEVSLKEGMNVDVFEKNSNGWWFVQLDNSQGWAPASYLDPVSHPLEVDEPDPTYTGDLEKYITTQEYTATMSDEISFEKDVIVEVMHKLLDGWWIVSYQGEAGYAPAAYLHPYQNPHWVRSMSVKRKSVKPIPRRCTIKNSKKSASKAPDRSRRDLSIYRKYSKKRKVQQPNFNAAPPPPKPPRIIEEEEEEPVGTNYVNEAFGDAIPEDEPEYLEMEHTEECNDLYENIAETGFAVLTSQLPPPAPPRPGERDLETSRTCDLPNDDLDPNAPTSSTLDTPRMSTSSDCMSIPDGEPDFMVLSALAAMTHGKCRVSDDGESARSSTSGYSSGGAGSVFNDTSSTIAEPSADGAVVVTRL